MSKTALIMVFKGTIKGTPSPRTKNHHQIRNTFQNTAEIQVKCHPDLWLCPLFLLPHQSPSSSPPPPPPSSSSSRPRSTSHPFPPSRFSSDLVSHYLSEIKTSVPRIPQNLRGLRRGVRQEVVFKCVWLRQVDMSLFFVFFYFFHRVSAVPWKQQIIYWVQLNSRPHVYPKWFRCHKGVIF